MPTYTTPKGREADLEARRMLIQEPINVVACTCVELSTRYEKFHICEGCLSPTHCQLLSLDRTMNMRLCPPCCIGFGKRSQAESGATLAGVFNPASIDNPSLFCTSKSIEKSIDVPYTVIRLRRLIKTDARIGKYSDAKVAAIYKNTTADLIRGFAVYTDTGEICKWKDAYFDAELQDHGKFSCITFDSRFLISLDDTQITQHGRRHSPWVASCDAKYQVELDHEGNVGYHVSPNVVTTSDSANRMKWQFPDTIFLGIAYSQSATTVEELERVAAFMEILYINGQETAYRKAERFATTLSKARVEEIHTAADTVSLLKIRQVPETHLFKITYGSLGKSSQSWLPPTYGYFWPQLEKIAQLEGFENRPDLWQRNGIFFPYSSRTSEKVEWTWRSAWKTFCTRLSIMTNTCNRQGTSVWTAEIVMMVILRLYLRMMKPLMTVEGKPAVNENGLQLYAARDELGLELQPIVGHPLASVIGHRVHGQDMTHGYQTIHPEFSDQESWCITDCNVVLQTKIDNYSIWDFPAETYEAIRKQPQNLRMDRKFSNIDMVKFSNERNAKSVAPSSAIDELIFEKSILLHDEYSSGGVDLDEAIISAVGRTQYDEDEQLKIDDGEDRTEENYSETFLHVDQTSDAVESNIDIGSAFASNTLVGLSVQTPGHPDLLRNGLQNTGNTCYVNSAVQVFNILEAGNVVCSEDYDLTSPALKRGNSVGTQLRTILTHLRGPPLGTPVSMSTFCDNVLQIANINTTRFQGIYIFPFHEF